MNKVFRKIHLWLSVPVGLIITVICLTGAALVFERDITESLNPEIYKVTYTEGDTPLPPSELVASIRRQVPDSLKLLSLQLPGERDAACMATFKGSGKRSLSVNPYTGEVNGWTKSYPFFQTMRQMHRWLMDPPPVKGVKTVGKVVVGVTTIIMMVILVSGLVIWWPRTRKALKNRLSVSCNKGWWRFWYDSHVSLGFYATLLLLVMGLTGLPQTFQWYRTLAYGLFGVSTARPAMPARPEQGKQEMDLYFDVTGNLFKEVADGNDDRNEGMLPSQMPVAIQSVIDEKYPNARIVDFELERGQYEVELVYNNQSIEMIFDGEYNWVRTSTDMERQVPAVVRDAVAAQYPGKVIDDCDFVETASEKYYLVNLIYNYLTICK